MNAQLKPIESRVSVRPTYDNTFLGYETDWIVANQGPLVAWWNECADLLGERLPHEDFVLFCRAQHDVQLAIREEFKQTLRMY